VKTAFEKSQSELKTTPFENDGRHVALAQVLNVFVLYFHASLDTVD
jgi:hypothetical protein